MADTASLKLNKQQLKAVNHGNGPLLIIAGAGTGKTTVVTERIKYLIASGKVLPQEILALTFTEKASREMEERVDVAMPYGYTQMWISTFHAFCDRVLRNEALAVGLDTKFRLMTEAESIRFLRKNLFNLELSYFRPLGNPTRFVAGILQHFSRLKDEDVLPGEYLAWTKSKEHGTMNKEESGEAKRWEELSKAYVKYEELKIKEGVVDYADLISNTLKLFRERKDVLARYHKQFKYILVDEFQDTNIAQNELVKLLTNKEQNLTVVADDDQCLPGSSKVSTPIGDKLIRNVRVGQEVITAVGKGYLSSSKVIHVNKVKRKARFLTFTTESGKNLAVTDNHKMFCMIPGRKYQMSDFYYIYLMWRKGMGWRLGITDDIPQRLRLERSADKILAVKACRSLEEAKFFETVYSMKYQIPTYPFKPRKRMVLTGEWLSKIFSTFNTEDHVHGLAQDLGIDLNAHHYCLSGVVRDNKERVKVILKICSRKYRVKDAKSRLLKSPQVLHEVTVETSSMSALKKLKQSAIPYRKAKRGWVARKCFSDIVEAGEYAKLLERLTGGIFESKFFVGKRSKYSRSALVMPAKNIFEGMYVPVVQGYEVVYERVTSRKEVLKTQVVYDLEIDRTHNFVADGIIVHNSIYKWRGAAVSNVIQFRKSYPKTKVVALTQNYRSTQVILDSAYKLIQNNNPDRLEVTEKIDKKLRAINKEPGEDPQFIHTDRVENEADQVAKKVLQLIEEGYSYSDCAVLVRANNHAEPFSRAFSRLGIPHQFLGPGQLFRQEEVKELVAYLKVLYNFEDSACMYKVLTMKHIDIPARDIAVISNYTKKNNCSFFEACENAEDLRLSDSAKVKVNKLVKMIHNHLKLVPKETAGQILYKFLEESGLLQELVSSKSPGDERRAQNISKLFDRIKTYESQNEDASVYAVVDWIDLSLDVGESPRAADFDWGQENAVNILTIHSSKGLEFPVVFVVNLVAQRFPTSERKEQIPIPEELIKEILPRGDYHLQEERRLFYVALTRAKECLYITAADYYGEGKREKKLSPFVFEVFSEQAIQPHSSRAIQQLSMLDFAPQPGEVAHRPITGNIMTINYLSYSQIDCFKICPLHYKLRYILGIPTAPAAPLSFGSSLHNVMKDFNGMLTSGSLKKPEKTIWELLDKHWITEGYADKKHELEMKKRGKEYLVNYLKSDLFKPDSPPALLEQRFTFGLGGGLKIGGVIDRVDETKNGVEIIDYKTTDFAHKEVPTESELRKDLQLSVYAMAANKVREAPLGRELDEITLSLYYFDLGKKVSTIRRVEDLEKATGEIMKVKEAIETSDFSCGNSFFCRDCEYKMFCGVNE